MLRAVLDRLAATLRTGAKPQRRATFTEEQLRDRFGYDVASMIANGHDPAIVAEHATFNANVDRFVIHPVFGPYLRNRLPETSYEASGVFVLAIENLAAEIRDLAPASTLLTLGYFPIASSNGDLIVFEADSERVWWASHELFSADDPRSGLVQLSDDLNSFLQALDADQLTERLAALVRGA